MSKTITIGSKALHQLTIYLTENNFSAVYILADTNTSQFCLPILFREIPQLQNCHVIVINEGEKNKTLISSEQIVSELLEHHADRKSLLINLGGGIVTDLGGFTASVYKRGIKFINLPTSLMAMIDASIGGKTGVNSTGVKNIIGTFTIPETVFIYPEFLNTLPNRELKSAYSEVIKHILLSDEAMWMDLKADVSQFFSSKRISEIISHSVNFKESVVKNDFTDKNHRQILNFGHTLGHAIEAYSFDSPSPLNHGEAIAVGMVGELYLSSKLTGLDLSILKDVINVILTLYPDLTFDFRPDNLFPLLIADKKNNLESIGFSLLESVGKPAGTMFPSSELISESILFMTNVFADKNHLVND